VDLVLNGFVLEHEDMTLCPMDSVVQPTARHLYADSVTPLHLRPLRKAIVSKMRATSVSRRYGIILTIFSGTVTRLRDSIGQILMPLRSLPIFELVVIGVVGIDEAVFHIRKEKSKKTNFVLLRRVDFCIGVVTSIWSHIEKCRI